MKPLHILLFSLLLRPQLAVGQDSSHVLTDAEKQQAISTLIVLEDLSKSGLMETEDAIKASPEFRRLLEDSIYRQTMYPETYTWDATAQWLEAWQIKKALWFVINLYPESDQNKEKAIRACLALGSALKIDEALANTFSTYCYADPEVSVIVDGHPEIQRPDIMEQKMRDLKELLAYIQVIQEAERPD